VESCRWAENLQTPWPLPSEWTLTNRAEQLRPCAERGSCRYWFDGNEWRCATCDPPPIRRLIEVELTIGQAPLEFAEKLGKVVAVGEGASAATDLRLMTLEDLLAAVQR
jgi:hypothetical protein